MPCTARYFPYLQKNILIHYHPVKLVAVYIPQRQLLTTAPEVVRTWRPFSCEGLVGLSIHSALLVYQAMGTPVSRTSRHNDMPLPWRGGPGVK